MLCSCCSLFVVIRLTSNRRVVRTPQPLWRCG